MELFVKKVERHAAKNVIEITRLAIMPRLNKIFLTICSTRELIVYEATSLNT